jgi:hypothetical protein
MFIITLTKIFAKIILIEYHDISQNNYYRNNDKNKYKYIWFINIFFIV